MSHIILRHHFKGAVPAGSYYATDTATQYAAIKYARKRGKRLAKEHPEISELYKEGKTYIEIARLIMPEYAEQYPGTASKAVGYAMREINTREEQEKITHDARSRIFTEAIGDRKSPKNVETWRRAQKIRTKKHGTPLAEMIRGRGQTPWSAEERRDFVMASKLDSYLKPSGSPDYEKLASFVNNKFHKGKPIRTAKSLGNYLRDLWRKERNKKNKG